MKTLLIALAAPLLVTTAFADTIQGRIDRIDYSKDVMVIDDTLYRLAKNLRVVDEDDERISLFTVEKGRYVRAETEGEREQKVITELQLMEKAPAIDDDEASVRDD